MPWIIDLGFFVFNGYLLLSLPWMCSSMNVFGVRSTVVERATHMRVYACSSPTGADHRKEFISALSFSPNEVK